MARGAADALPTPEGDIVFLDPPYREAGEYHRALSALAPAPPRLVVVQHDRRLELEPAYGPLDRVRELRQGDNVLSFYRAKRRAAPPDQTAVPASASQT
jgi:16S rRNA G966 N2-methylase RsmD